MKFPEKILSVLLCVAVFLTGCRNEVPIDSLKLTQTVSAYSHNSYDSYSTRWPDDDIAAQLNAGIRILEFDLWGTDGSIAHDEETINPHCGTISNCLEIVDQWSQAHPEHSPIMILFEMTDNGTKVQSGEGESAQLAERINRVKAKADLLAENIQPYVQAGRTITYQQSLQPVKVLRGKFLVAMYRKFNTPFYLDPASDYSGNQTISLDKALELTRDTDTGNHFRQAFINNNLFISPRWMTAGEEWPFDDPDYLAMIRIEQDAGLAGQMLEVLKQDNSDYSNENLNDNVYMISEATANSAQSQKSFANGFGTHGFDNLNKDPLVKAILASDDKILAHCTRSGMSDLVYCE